MTTITFDVAVFRAQYPAFADTSTYPDALLQSYWDQAVCFVSDSDYGCLAGACRQQAINAMTAHLCRLNELIVSGNQPGVAVGSTVGSVSVSLAQPPFGSDPWRYWLNQTPYGQQLLALLSAASVGGFYVGGNAERNSFRRAGGGFGGPLF